MAYIKAQKLRLDADGNVLSGSAELMVSRYDSSAKGKSRKELRESLGKVLYIDKTHTCGIFLSPTRGLIEYDSGKDEFSPVAKDDPRLKGKGFASEPAVHTVFGDSYLILCFMEKCGMIGVLREAFSSDSDYERVLCHVVHGICRNGGRISCDDFLRKSFLQYVLPDVPLMGLGSDSPYFEKMGQDESKVSFFRSFVGHIKKENSGFGKGCYVDSTPLPNGIRDNPFNALCSHGVEATSVQTRLVLVLDEDTGLPIWFTVIPGNILDFSTVKSVTDDVSETLDIRIDSMVLDAGYASEKLLAGFNRDGTADNEKSILVRMPAKKGYPYKALYNKVKGLLHNSKYQFDRNGHTYFGLKRETVIFGHSEYAFVYVDKDNALELARKNRLRDPEGYESLSMAEKNWYDTKFGYFVLLSNKDGTPEEKLDEYFSRTDIETVFKTGKKYLSVLPLEKWNAERVKGKLLSDIIERIIYLLLQKELSGEGIATTRLLGSTQSLMCRRKKDGNVEVEVANRQTDDFYKKLGIKVPSDVDMERFRKDTLKLKD